MSTAQSTHSRSTWRMRWMTLTMVFLLGLFIARLPATLAQISGKPSFLEPVQDVYRMLSTMYVDAPSAEKLQKGAIDGMLEALDDPYAEYIPADDTAEFNKQMTGQFVGIGCQVESRDGWLTVVTPLEDSPALAAGILAGDRIIRIEDKSTMGLGVDACIKMLTGEPHTPVNILVQRDGKEIPFTITRQKIVSKSVRGYRRLVDGTGHWDFAIDRSAKIAYIRLSQFTPTSPGELIDALADAERSMGQVGGLILDLRNNPGGYMESAIEIVDMFIADGVIMSVRGRDGANEQVFRASPKNELPDFPMLVMINAGSASASEIVAGALSDHNRAVVLGQRSFGKGLVQTVQNVPHNDKAQIKFTTQRYYLPSGRLIQRLDESTQWGVDPTPGFYVPMSEQETIAWILHRRDQDILKKDSVPADFAEQRWTDPAWIETAAKDSQLGAALRAVQGRLAAGEWPKVSTQDEQHGKIAEAELRALERARLRMSRDFARVEKRIETLERVANTGKEPERRDLWPDTLDLTEGRVSVTDKTGKVVATLKITGRDLERWLENADVKLEPSTEPEPAKP